MRDSEYYTRQIGGLGPTNHGQETPVARTYGRGQKPNTTADNSYDFQKRPMLPKHPAATGIGGLKNRIAVPNCYTTQRRKRQDSDTTGRSIWSACPPATRRRVDKWAASSFRT